MDEIGKWAGIRGWCCEGLVGVVVRYNAMRLQQIG